MVAVDWYILFFVFLWVFGVFFVLAVVVGYFQFEFSNHQVEVLQQQTMLGRTGLVAAFILIDIDESGGISVDEFRQFVSGCCDGPQSRALLVKAFETLDTNQDGQMDLYEFVTGMEKLKLHRLLRRDKPSRSNVKWRVWMRENVFQARSDWWRKLIEVLLLVELLAASLYGLYSPIQHIDAVCHTLLLLFVVEMAAKLVVYGIDEV